MSSVSSMNALRSASVNAPSDMGTRMRLKKTALIQLVVDVSIFILAGIPLLLVHILVKPFKRGFFCDDQSIQHPYKPDTVPMITCAIIGSIIGIVSFIVIEFSLSLGCRKTRDSRLFQVLWSLAKIIVIFTFGIGATLILTETAKLCLGRLRPNFLDVCRPDMSSLNCSNGFIEHFICTNTELPEKVIHDSRKSFPSGHSSYVCYVAVFLGFYYQKRLAIEFTVLLKTFLQVAVAVLAMFVMFSRISDYKHHWSDVLGGCVLGLAVGAWTIACLGQHMNLSIGRSVAHNSSSATLTQLPLSDPCTPEPATFLGQPRFNRNEV